AFLVVVFLTRLYSTLQHSTARITPATGSLDLSAFINCSVSIFRGSWFRHFLSFSFDLCSPLPRFDTLIGQSSFPLITSVITIGITFVLLSLLLVVYWKVQSDRLSSEVDIYS